VPSYISRKPVARKIQRDYEIVHLKSDHSGKQIVRICFHRENRKRHVEFYDWGGHDKTNLRKATGPNQAPNGGLRAYASQAARGNKTWKD
jgi:hypothetical protein